MLCLLVSALTLYFSAVFSISLCFLLIILSFKMAYKHIVEALSTLPKCWKSLLWLMEEIPVLTRLLSGMSFSAVGCESSVNESAMYIK